MSKQSYRELKSLAKVQGIKGYYKMKKAELLKELKIDDSADTSRKIMGQKREVTDQKLLHYYCIHDRYKYQCRSCQGIGGGSGILETQIFIFFLEYFANFDIPKSFKGKYSYSSIHSNQIFLS